MESIKEMAVTTKLVIESETMTKYTLVAGERRLRAHKLAKLIKLKQIIIDLKNLN